VSIREQCEAAESILQAMVGVRKVKNGRELQSRLYDEYPERVTVPSPGSHWLHGVAENVLKPFRGMLKQNI
jgi:hypothetical protein